MRIGIRGEQAVLLGGESCEQRICREAGGSNCGGEHGSTAGMLGLMVTTGCRLFLGAGLGAGREGAARGAEGRREKAKDDQQGTEVREDAVIAGAHTFIVRGVGWEGIVFLERGGVGGRWEFERDAFRRRGVWPKRIWECLSHLRCLCPGVCGSQRLRAGRTCFAPPALNGGGAVSRGRRSRGRLCRRRSGRRG